MTKVGYVGLGAMGGSLCQHLIEKFDVTVLDRNPTAIQTIVAKGAKAAVGAADFARASDIIVLCLPRTLDVQEALFSAGGLAEGLSAGQLVIDQTSGAPADTEAIARILGRRGILFLDAPVSGGIPAAQAGKVTIIASGKDGAWAKAEPVLRAMSHKVFRCSDRVGDGQALKLVNNAMGAVYRMATLELVALCRKAGLGLAPIVDHLNNGRAANFTTKNMLAGLVEDRSTTNFSLALMVKDLDEALHLGSQTHAPMPMTAAARSVMQTGLALFGDGAKLDDVIPLTEQLAAVKLRGDGLSDADVLAQLDVACLACNVAGIGECANVGHAFGLLLTELARILNVGSAWSAASEVILPALAANTVPQINCTLGQAEDALTAMGSLSAKRGTPFLLPAQALARVQDSLLRHGRDSTLGYLALGKTSSP
jgi:3-hydroxyisobutyrate dehydrogenase